MSEQKKKVLHLTEIPCGEESGPCVLEGCAAVKQKGAWCIETAAQKTSDLNLKSVFDHPECSRQTHNATAHKARARGQQPRWAGMPSRRQNYGPNNCALRVLAGPVPGDVSLCGSDMKRHSHPTPRHAHRLHCDCTVSPVCLQ